MTREKFENLVRRLEVSAAGHMKSYRLKVAMLATVGYFYVFFVLAVIAATLLLLVGLLVGGIGTYAAIKLGLPVGALGLAVVRSLWVRWPEPVGIRIRSEQAPKLFEHIEAIRRKLRAPKIHRVFIDDNYNAAMEQRPRLG